MIWVDLGICHTGDLPLSAPSSFLAPEPSLPCRGPRNSGTLPHLLLHSHSKALLSRLWPWGHMDNFCWVCQRELWEVSCCEQLFRWYLHPEKTPNQRSLAASRLIWYKQGLQGEAASSVKPSHMTVKVNKLSEMRLSITLSNENSSLSNEQFKLNTSRLFFKVEEISKHMSKEIPQFPIKSTTPLPGQEIKIATCSLLNQNCICYYFCLTSSCPQQEPSLCSSPPHNKGLLTFTLLPSCHNVCTHHCSHTQQTDGNSNKMYQPVSCSQNEPRQSHQHRNPKTVQELCVQKNCSS